VADVAAYWGTPWAIEAVGLEKRFGGTPAVHGVDLRVGWGERVVLLGPNGAGKTTLLRLLALALRPTAGQLRLGGHDPAAAGPALRRHVGFAGHQAALYPDLTVAENLELHAALFGVAHAARRVALLLERFGLGARRGDRVRHLSRGFQQRAALARALVHDPPILLLDEPDAGLDAAALDLVAGLLSEAGRTVVASTHDRTWGRRVTDGGGREVVLERGRVADRGWPAPETGAAGHRAACGAGSER
jgi:ABC-type multidrug transport system ATPase subunit